MQVIIGCFQDVIKPLYLCIQSLVFALVLLLILLDRGLKLLIHLVGVTQLLLGLLKEPLKIRLRLATQSSLISQSVEFIHEIFDLFLLLDDLTIFSLDGLHLFSHTLVHLSHVLIELLDFLLEYRYLIIVGFPHLLHLLLG